MCICPASAIVLGSLKLKKLQELREERDEYEDKANAAEATRRDMVLILDAI